MTKNIMQLSLQLLLTEAHLPLAFGVFLSLGVYKWRGLLQVAGLRYGTTFSCRISAIFYLEPRICGILRPNLLNAFSAFSPTAVIVKILAFFRPFTGFVRTWKTACAQWRSPDLELRGGGEGGWGKGGGLLALPAFLPSAIFLFFTQNKGARRSPRA